MVDCLENILQASRCYDVDEPRTELQQLSDIIVSAEEVGFHLGALLAAPSLAAFTAASYLAMVVARMNQDESQDGLSRPFRPTFLYQVDALFAAFAKLAIMAVRVAGG